MHGKIVGQTVMINHGEINHGIVKWCIIIKCNITNQYIIRDSNKVVQCGIYYSHGSTFKEYFKLLYKNGLIPPGSNLWISKTGFTHGCIRVISKQRADMQ